MLGYEEFTIWQVSIILRDVSFIICDVRSTAKVIAVIEVGILLI